MREKSLKQLNDQWHRISSYVRAKGLFWKFLSIRCRYSLNMQKFMDKPVIIYGKVNDEELYNKPVPKSVYCGSKHKNHTPSLFDFE